MLLLSDGYLEQWIVSEKTHELKGDLRGYHSLTVNGNWRIIFKFVGTDTELVDYLDYH